MLFKSFTGLTVREFDDIYDKEIAKRHGRHEIRRLSKRKGRRERSIGAGRHFKLDVKNRFLMLLVYYRLYITYTLAGFLFDLDQSNVCRDIQKIEPLVRKCVPIPQKMHKIAKRLRTPEEVEQTFRVLLLSRIAQNSKFQDQRIKKEGKCTIQERKRDTPSKINLWLTTRVSSFTKQTIRKEKGMTITSIKRIILSLQSKL